MGWTYRVPEHHEHNTPKTVTYSTTNKTLVGDRWTCVCGKIFEVTAVKVTYDQKDGNFAYLSWTAYQPSSGVTAWRDQ